MFFDLLAYLLAICVPILAVYLLLQLDFLGTGKDSLLIISLLWGALGAVGGAYVINQYTIQHFGYFRTTTLTAPFAEELLKALILFYLIQQPRFRYFIDGAIYGFTVGMGFAISENLFYILIDQDGEVLSLIIKRVLSSSLMHGFATSILGISLGLMRRTSGWRRWLLPLLGFGSAIAIHLIYNNIVTRLKGADLLIVAFGIGIGGSLIIASFIFLGLQTEKRRFAQTLGLDEGVSGGERRALQQLGENKIAAILQELELSFGKEKGLLIEKLLIKQANIGVLKNNLSSPASPRLQNAWQAEIRLLRGEVDQIRQKLGLYIMMLLRSLLPEDDDLEWLTMKNMVLHDPLHCHQFDLFMVVSKIAQTHTPEELSRLGQLLQKMKIFEGLDLADLENLSRAIILRQLKKGELLFQRDDAGDALYLVEEGHLEVYTHLSTGEELPIRTITAGNVVGELALLDGLPRSASVRAKIASRVWMLQRTHFLMFVQSRPHVILALLVFLAERLRYSTEMMLEEDLNDRSLHAKTRVAEAIRELGTLRQSSLQVQISLADISVN